MIPAGLRRYLWVSIIASGLLLLAVAALDSSGPETADERTQRLSESFACPICKGQAVAESNAGVSATIRQFIRIEVSAGSTDDMIRDDLILAYGEQVLLTPPAEGVGSLIWILPVVVLVGGCAALGLVLTRKRGDGRELTAIDQQLVDEARTRLDQ